jgi:O-antigen ligase
MGRMYAGILGPLAMAVVICRGWLGSAGAIGTLTQATLFLALFAIVGAILGHLAQSTVDESVRAKLQAELEEKA